LGQISANNSSSQVDQHAGHIIITQSAIASDQVAQSPDATEEKPTLTKTKRRFSKLVTKQNVETLKKVLHPKTKTGSSQKCLTRQV
jgi:hypothetical protein